jgi:hypothetical protein
MIPRTTLEIDPVLTPVALSASDIELYFLILLPLGVSWITAIVFLLLVLAFLDTVLAGAALATTFTVLDFVATVLVALAAGLAAALTVLA